MTTAKERFQRAVEELVSRGVYPAPTAIHKLLSHGRFRHDLNGREMVWREEVLLRLGWRRHPNANVKNWRAGHKFPRFVWLPPAGSTLPLTKK